ncbi:hypothetical protein FNV43_RR05696 [Rhamnella rubrinervis]|uniref:Uncharacterized protein n=1 Tax=Rhamnella rubrinervis TaxID=2594499 RepID=A0A8K0HPH2_9ROSA|nr:hypothetical protein FNV43_RR05696 [Rhamnella rubrinervis]
MVWFPFYDRKRLPTTIRQFSIHFDPDSSCQVKLTLYAEPSARRDDLEEHRPKFFIQHPTLIKTDIPSIFKPENMPYLKERANYPVRKVWTTNRYAFYARRQIRLLKNMPTSDKGWKEREGLFDLVGTSHSEVCSAWIERGNSNREQFMTRYDRVDLKGMSFEEISQEAKQNALKLAQSCRFFYKEEEVKHPKKIAGDATSRSEQLEKKWSKANLKLVEREKELESLSEISSGEDKPEGDAGGEYNVDNPPKDPPPAPERTASPTRDSFIKAMEAVRSERAGPSTNAEEVTSAAQPNQEELH